MSYRSDQLLRLVKSLESIDELLAELLAGPEDRPLTGLVRPEPDYQVLAGAPLTAQEFKAIQMALSLILTTAWVHSEVYPETVRVIIGPDERDIN